MGAYLNTPITEKEQDEGENSWVKFASTSMQGWRAHQEDAHNCILDFDTNLECSLFGVYDGHGGSEVAQYIAQNFPQFLKSSGLLKGSDVVAALKKGFVDFDATLKSDEIVQIMNTLKETESSTSRKEMDEAEEREALFEEAMKKALASANENNRENFALSKEASVSLETIIRQYAKIRNRMEPTLVFQNEEIKSEKRVLGEPSGRLVKRRRIHRENATALDDEDMGEATGSASDAGSAVSCSETGALKVNGNTEISLHRDDAKNSAESEAVEITNFQKKIESDETTGILASPTIPKTKIANADTTQNTEIALGEDLVTSSTSVNSPVAGNLFSKKVEVEADSNTDEEDDDEDYDGEGEEDEVVGESESDEDDKEDDDEVGGPIGNKPGFDSGATACLALLFKDRVVVANVGDSRAILCRDGKAIDLSVDHKPEDVVEKNRIEKAGGIVSEDGRVNGGLNLSRALGDHYYKQNAEIDAENQMISAMPDVVESDLTEKDTLLVVACDGIWNSMTSQEVVDFINERLPSKSIKEIGAEICSYCCAPDTSGDGTGCDNMTIIILDLNNVNSINHGSEPALNKKADDNGEHNVGQQE